jgi:N-sulfoglucosamine sulfohydrolase
LSDPGGLDGRSLVSLFKGGAEEGRAYVFTQIDYTIGGPPKPMRCIQDEKFGYIFNAFSDGKFEYKNNNEGETFKAMQAAGATDAAIQERVDMFRHRVPQEFYDLEKDPECVNNLLDNPEYQEAIKGYQARLREWMVETNDHCIAAFDVREDPAKLAEAIVNYPKLVKPPKAEEAASESKPDTEKATDDARAAARKAKRAARKAAEDSAGKE